MQVAIIDRLELLHVTCSILNEFVGVFLQMGRESVGCCLDSALLGLRTHLFLARAKLSPLFGDQCGPLDGFHMLVVATVYSRFEEAYEGGDRGLHQSLVMKNRVIPRFVLEESCESSPCQVCHPDLIGGVS